MRALAVIGLLLAIALLAPPVGLLIGLALAAHLHFTYRKETP